MKQTVVSRLLAPAVVASSLLAFAPASNAAVFDFVAWVADPANDEQGFENSSPFSLSNMGVTLTAKAFENPPGPNNNTASHVYLDGLSSTKPGGMGVCTSLKPSAQCDPSSDDNVSIDSGVREILAWKFNQNVNTIDLKMGDADHDPFATKSFQYNIGSGWMDAMTDASASAQLDLGGSDKIRFRVNADQDAGSFYIQTADVTVVPVPAAVWLFGSGLIGLVAVARRKRLV